jgi:hypothetical protein
MSSNARRLKTLSRAVEPRQSPGRSGWQQASRLDATNTTVRHDLEARVLTPADKQMSNVILHVPLELSPTFIVALTPCDRRLTAPPGEGRRVSSQKESNGGRFDHRKPPLWSGRPAISDIDAGRYQSRQPSGLPTLPASRGRTATDLVSEFTLATQCGPLRPTSKCARDERRLPILSPTVLFQIGNPAPIGPWSLRLVTACLPAQGPVPFPL